MNDIHLKRKLMKLVPKSIKSLAKSKDITESAKERGLRQLMRLNTIIDILYALMIFRVFLLLPRPEIDHFGAEQLIEVLTTSYMNYLVMVVGIILILIYWGQNNLQSGNLVRTDGKHSVLSLLQAFCLMIYLYFVRLDMEFDGAVITLQMESAFLALAGLFSILSWAYAIENNLLSDNVSVDEKRAVYLKLMPEPIVSVLSFPFAIYGPNIWTLSWLMLIPVSIILKRLRHRLVVNNAQVKSSE